MMTVVCVVNVENGLITPDMLKQLNSFKSDASIIITIVPIVDNSPYIFINRLTAGNAELPIIKMLHVIGYLK